MRVLVVHAHPLEQSLTRHFSDGARTTLEASGHQVDFVDLYQDGFDPRLTAQERANHYKPLPPTADIAPLVEKLRAAEAVVLVFPTWWFGMPAIMKGFIDRVFAPDVAWAHGENFGPIKPLLTGLRHAVVITTLGTPWWVDWLAMRRPLRRMLKTAVFGACAPSARFDYLAFYASENPGQLRVEAFTDRIASRLAAFR